MKYRITYKKVGNKFVFHADVYTKWSPSMKRDFINDGLKILKELKNPVIYCSVPAHDIKLNKFVKMLKFRKTIYEWHKDCYSILYRLDPKCYKYLQR